jgi:hypothetical protein
LLLLLLWLLLLRLWLSCCLLRLLRAPVVVALI